MTTVYVNWGTSRVKLTWTPSHQPPNPTYITSVHGMCFHDEQLLLVDIKSRGWNFPGGHIELNETPVACAQREIFEEACVEGECSYLGYVEVDHSKNPAWNSDSPYPMIGFQAFFRMNITKIHPFKPLYESSRRMFIHPSEAMKHNADWHDVYEAILRTSLETKKVDI